jgi:abortive infection bacteriophage resistance protein
LILLKKKKRDISAVLHDECDGLETKVEVPFCFVLKKKKKAKFPIWAICSCYYFGS